MNPHLLDALAHERQDSGLRMRGRRDQFGETMDRRRAVLSQWLAPRMASPPVHAHPTAEESFEAIEGDIEVFLGGKPNPFATGRRRSRRSARCTQFCNANAGAILVGEG